MSAVVTRRSLRPRRPRRRAAARVVVPVAALAVVAVWVIGAATAPTQAAFRDQANLNAAIGSGRPFDIALVQDGVLRQAEGDGVAWSVDGATGLLPGHVVTFDVPVVNNGPYDATVLLSVEDRHAETATSGPGSDPVALYRWSVADAQTGEVLAGAPGDPLASTVTTDGLGAALAPVALAGRTLPAVDDGAAWTSDPAAPGDHRVLRVSIAYPDTPGATPFNGGHSVLALMFTGESA